MAPEILVDTVHEDHRTEARSATESTSDGIERKIRNTPLFHSSFLVAPPREHGLPREGDFLPTGEEDTKKTVSLSVVLLENVNPGSHIGPKWI